MHVALSEVLACPRCGPMYGLVLLPLEVRDRRVRDGVLGCPNCRERYPIGGGVADLRRPGEVEAGEVRDPGPGARAGPEPVPDPDIGVRLAALLGLTDPGGTVLVAGPISAHGPPLAGVAREVEVVVAGEEGSGLVGAGESAPPVSRIRVSGVLPFRSGSLRGVALSGRLATALLEEGARVVGMGGRLVLEDLAGEERAGVRARVEAAGLRVLLEEDGILVAGR